MGGDVSNRDRVLTALRRVGRGGLLFGQIRDLAEWRGSDADLERLLMSMHHDALIHRSLGRWRFGAVAALVDGSALALEQEQYPEPEPEAAAAVVATSETVHTLTELDALMTWRREAMLTVINDLISEHMTRADELIRQREQLLEVMA